MDETNDVLELLAEHELVLKKLYTIYTSIFKDHEAIWRKLADDEQNHADWLMSLRPYPSIIRWLDNESNLKPQSISNSIRYVEDQIQKAMEGGITYMQALSTARDLESALIERQFSRMKAAAPDEIAKVMARLCQETEKHLKTVVDEISSEKK